MTDSQRKGPSKVVLLNCGKFDFAEVELDAPLHLVGPNNVGKTSLIALLQMLYIDDQRQMHFAREMPETRRYYFPDVHSFALFECLTPTGFQVVGAHGLGPVRQYEFERFSYAGRLDATDYLDTNRRIRPHEEIFRALADRDFTRLKPNQLRAALTGVGDSRGVDLGLVPARHSGAYERFRKVFNNILRLSHLKQDELKRLILDIFEGEFQQRSINLADTYAQGFEKVQHDSREVQDLKRLQDDIEALLKHIERRDECRRMLPALWQAMGQAVTEAHARLDRYESALRQQLQKSEERSKTVQDCMEQISGKIAEQDHRLGELNGNVQRIDEERRRLADFLPDWAEQRQHDVRRQIDRLAFRLGQSEQTPEGQLQARLKRLDADILQKRRRLQGLAEAAIHWLREHFDDSELADLFRLLSPELLSLPVKGENAPGGIEDDAHARKTLRAVLDMRDGGMWRGAGVRINLAGLPPPEIDAYRNPATIEREIHDLESQQSQCRQALEGARDAAKLRSEKQALEDELTRLIRDLSDYHRLQEQASHEQTWRADIETIEKEQAARKAERSELEEERLRLGRAADHSRSEMQRIDQRRDELDRTVRDIERPASAWPMVPCDDLPDDLDELKARYHRAFEDQRIQQNHVDELLNRIERQTYSRYARADESATVAALREQLESIPLRERAVQELWTGIAVGIKKALSNIGHDLDTLKALVQRLNRQIGRVTISNLTSLRVLVHERPDWVRHIRGVNLNEDMPLFADAQTVRQSFDDLGRLLSEHPRVDLEDLFDLQFEVGTPDERVQQHAHLDAIESNGTTITIKVLVNLVLLQGLLEGANVRIPFYLDECSSLDNDNLAALVRAAREMGFVAVLASPDAMDAADRLYFMTEQENGRVVLDPASSLVRIVDREASVDH
ncbi:hypothetical protein [Kiritimatiella glycovorans]|uniref:Chromosome segregation protein n=1 Tax=Kiritimatiella glycovorans TaxID=1307763 RepID=A0A0G3EFN9_9BACT|nr:hypothetical protein [Kiritimatiella glycovorans]AKJ64222.1 chromosome segregation protein [Kiritimatiella glycovorans]